jgi:hypothetical protein
MGGQAVKVYTGYSCTLHTTGVGEGGRGKNLTPSHFYETPYEVSFRIVHVVVPQVYPFSSFYFPLGYFLTPPESDPCPCEEEYHPFQPVLPFTARSSFLLVPYWTVTPRISSKCARLAVITCGEVALWLGHLHPLAGFHFCCTLGGVGDVICPIQRIQMCICV